MRESEDGDQMLSEGHVSGLRRALPVSKVLKEGMKRRTGNVFVNSDVARNRRVAEDACKKANKKKRTNTREWRPTEKEGERGVGGRATQTEGKNARKGSLAPKDSACAARG